jgi:hypothetical protein
MRTLVLGQLAGYRAANGWFTTPEIARLFEDLRIPQPGNISEALRQLSRTGLVVRRRSKDAWSLTPAGRERVTQLVGELDPARLEAQLVHVPSAEFGHALHTLIPPTFAPVKWAGSINALLRRFPFDTNVFCMTRFPREREDQLPDPVRHVIKIAREVVGRHGLMMHLASDRQLDDDLWGNVAAHGWACRYGIGLFEDRLDQGLNENLVMEIGSMLMTGRRCALLKDRTVHQMPTDLVGQIYKTVDFDDLGAVAVELHEWAREDLGLGACHDCRSRP